MPPVAAPLPPQLDADAVRRLGELARLRIAEDRVAPLAAELTTIVAYVGQLSAFDGGEPPPPRATPRRPDSPRAGDVGDTLLPASQRVPRVMVENEG